MEILRDITLWEILKAGDLNCEEFRIEFSNFEDFIHQESYDYIFDNKRIEDVCKHNPKWKKFFIDNGFISDEILIDVGYKIEMGILGATWTICGVNHTVNIKHIILVCQDPKSNYQDTTYGNIYSINLPTTISKLKESIDVDIKKVYDREGALVYEN